MELNQHMLSYVSPLLPQRGRYISSQTTEHTGLTAKNDDGNLNQLKTFDFFVGKVRKKYSILTIEECSLLIF